jgi:hypothetical protein
MKSLFETIEVLDKAKRMLSTSWINKPSSLMHIHIFFKNSMEKSILNIQLMKRPSLCNSKKQKVNSIWFNNGTKCILVVKAIPLFETFSNQVSLVHFDGDISMILNLENSLGVNNINTRLRRNKTPLGGIPRTFCRSVYPKTPTMAGRLAQKPLQEWDGPTVTDPEMPAQAR